MSTTSLYQPYTVKIVTTTNGILELDASLREDHSAEVEVTEFPVEKGTAITDHARPKPREVTIEGIISNTPLVISATRPASSRGQPGTAETYYLALLDLYTTPELVTVTTPLESYSDMLMTKLHVPRDAQIGEVMQFSATFRHVLQVTNAITVVATKQPKAKPKAQQGTQSTTPVAPSQQQATGKLGNLWNTISTQGQSSPPP